MIYLDFLHLLICPVSLSLSPLSLLQRVSATITLEDVDSTWNSSSCQAEKVEEFAPIVDTTRLDVTAITVKKASIVTPRNLFPIGKLANVSKLCVSL